MIQLPPRFPTLTRRQLLQIGTVTLSGFDLLPVLRPLNVTAQEGVKPRGTADYGLFVFLQGGASHLDTFDIKEGRWKPPDYMPPFVSMNYSTDQCKEGCLDSKYGPLSLDTRGDFAFVVPDAERNRFARRVEYLRQMAALASGTAGTAPEHQLDIYRAEALSMMESPEIPKILKVDDEEKKRYGGSPFGDACVLARNILAANAGTRFVAIHH